MSRTSEPTGEDLAEAQATMQQLTNGYWATQIIYVAAKLGIADLLQDGPLDIRALSDATRTHAPSLYRLMRVLGSLGVFRENERGDYEATALGRCLLSESSGSVRARAILNGEDWYRGWGGLLHSVRTGETAFDQVYGMPFWQHMAGNPDVTAVFSEAMGSATESAGRAVAAAYDFSDFRVIVDVGGGTGEFLAEILKANPHARGVLFDRPHVVERAGGTLAGAGVANRCDVVGGDFFQGVRSGGDCYILSWIIHDWDDERSVALLRNCHRAMADHSRLLVLEQLIPPGNQPSLSKLYDLHMLALSGGRERREDEYRALFDAAGLRLARIIPTTGPRSVMEALR
jgi:O-methyltransferase domain/Dimerisation domain